jgi:type II secretion system protein N
MGKYRKWLVYVLFAATVGGFSLFLCFPSEMVRQYLEGSASRVDPAVALRIHRVQPLFPLGLKLEKTDLSLKEEPGISLFKADSFVVRPSIRTLVHRAPAFRFKCRAYGGSIEGIVALETLNWAGPVESDLEITGVRLGQYPLLREWLNRELTGAMSGTVTYRGTRNNFIKGSGKGDFSISDGTVRFDQPFLGMESVDFQRVNAHVVLEKQRISLTRCDFKGKQMEGEASGSIQLNPILPRSKLNLKVAVKPFSSFFRDNAGLFDMVKFLGNPLKEGNFTITLGGTLAEPQISFI